MLGLMLVGLLLISAGRTADAKRSKKADPECAAMPKDCCKDWRLFTDPERYEKDSGCKVSCCEKAARRKLRGQGSSAIMRQQVNAGQLFQCLRTLLDNLLHNRYDLPATCCQIPEIKRRGACQRDPNQNQPRHAYLQGPQD